MNSRRKLLQTLLLTCAAGCQPSAAVPLAVHALNRLAYGPTEKEREGFRALPDHLEEQLQGRGLADPEGERALQRAGLQTLHKPLPRLWAEHNVANPFGADTDKGYEWSVLPLRETIQATFLRAVYSRRQLLEVMVGFWHNHFSVYAWQDCIPAIFGAYDRDVIRVHALGNFREMLEAVAAHPAMLYYLGNAANQVAGPNENFARELLELHTLGARHYQGVRAVGRVGFVDNDVYEVARCFTGWRVDDEGTNTGQFRYESSWHDRFNKLVLGRYLGHDAPAQRDGRQVLDLLASHPGTASHIAEKLVRRLVCDDPPEALVRRAAATFQSCWQKPDQITRVLRTIVLSPEFGASRGKKTRRPFEFTVALLRGLQIRPRRLGETFLWRYDSLGQPLFGHPAPNGYPDRGPAWMHTEGMLKRWQFILSLCGGEFAAEGVKAPALEPGGLQTWSMRLFGVQMPAGLRPAGLEMLLMSPHFQSC